MAELAKIVTGRATGSSTPSRRAAPEPAPSRMPSGDALSDLEAELMSDLQASFASVREVPPPPPQPPRAAPQPERTPPPERTAAPPTPRMVPVEEEEIEIEEDVLEEEVLEAPVSFAPPRSYAPPPEQPAPSEPPSLRRQVEEQPVPRLVPTTPIIQPPSEPPASERLSERPTRAPRAPASDRLDIAAMAMRSTNGPSAGAASTSAPPSPTPSRQPHSRWERPEPAKPQAAAGASRFAPPSKSSPPARDDEDDLFGAGGIFAEAPDADPNDGPFDALGTPSEYPDEDVRPSFREDDIEKLAKRRGSRAPLMIIGVIAVVVLGGIAVAMFRPTGESSNPPPVIAANTDPTKITPDETQVAADDQNKLSYDRINSSDTSTDTTLLTPGDEPIADVGGNTSDNPITRVIIPAGPGFDQPGLDSSSADARQAAAPDDGGIGALASDGTTDAATGEELGPRRVRTVVVKPDGTIVESASAEEGAPAPTLPSQTAAAEPLPLPDPEPPRPVNDDTAAIAGTAANGELAITPDAAVDDLSSPPAAAAPQPPAQEPQQVAAAPATETPPAEVARSTSSGGALVQVSSQRSEDAALATFRDLQARYPSILGQYQPDVQRADIPDRGTFFRVRVGPFSAGDAQRLCNDLKAAGGDCIIAQR